MKVILAMLMSVSMFMGTAAFAGCDGISLSGKWNVLNLGHFFLTAFEESKIVFTDDQVQPSITVKLESVNGKCNASIAYQGTTTEINDLSVEGDVIRGFRAQATDHKSEIVFEHYRVD